MGFLEGSEGPFDSGIFPKLYEEHVNALNNQFLFLNQLHS